MGAIADTWSAEHHRRLACGRDVDSGLDAHRRAYALRGTLRVGPRTHRDRIRLQHFVGRTDESAACRRRVGVRRPPHRTGARTFRGGRAAVARGADPAAAADRRLLVRTHASRARRPERTGARPRDARIRGRRLPHARDAVACDSGRASAWFVAMSTLAAGARVGHYEIVAALGAGGMGHVYKARDTRLHRDVALKVLPESFATDPERVARFTREAQP